MIDLIKNILSGFQLAVFRPVLLWDFRFGKWQATWLLLILIGLSVIVEYLSVGWGAQINRHAISGFLLNLILALAGFFLIVQFLGYKNNGRYIVVALASVITVNLIAAFAEFVVHSIFLFSLKEVKNDALKMAADLLPLILFVLLLIWLIVVIMRTMQVAFSVSRAKSLIVSLAYFLLLGLSSYGLTLQQPLFLPAEKGQLVSLSE